MRIVLTPRNVTHILFKRWKVLCSVAFFCVAATCFYVLLADSQYESDASIVVNIGTGNMPKAQLDGGPQGPSETPVDLAKQIVNSHVQMMQSLDVRQTVLNKLGLAKVYPKIAANPPLFYGSSEDKALDRLSHDINVKVDRDSNVLSVSVLNPNPGMAQRVLRSAIETFFDLQARTFRDPQTAFMAQQLETAHKQMDSAQQALDSFKKKNDISSLDEEKTLVLNQRDDAEESLTTSLAQLANAQQRATALQKEVKSVPKNIALSDENDGSMKRLDDSLAQLNNVEMRYQQARETYTPSNPLLKDYSNDLDLAQRQYQEAVNASTSRVRSGANPVYQGVSGNLTQARADIAANTGTVKQWQIQLTALNQRLDRLNVLDGPLHDLQRRLDFAVQDYRTYLQRNEEARISSDLNRDRITSLGVIQQPTLPYQPAAPKAALLLILSVIVGVIGGLAICFGLESIDDTFTLPEQVESMSGLPVLVVLNRMPLATGH